MCLAGAVLGGGTGCLFTLRPSSYKGYSEFLDANNEKRTNFPQSDTKGRKDLSGFSPQILRRKMQSLGILSTCR